MFAEQLFEQRLRSITHRVRHWSRLNLTLLGRCEVARQVLASCLVYHAQFMPVPAHLMSPAAAPHQGLHAGHGLHRADAGRTLTCRPAAAVANLPASAEASGTWTCCPTSRPCRPRSQQLAAPAQVRMEAVHARQPGQAGAGRRSEGSGQGGRRHLDSGSTSAAQPPPRSVRCSSAGAGLVPTPESRGDAAWQVSMEPVVGNHSVADADHWHQAAVRPTRSRRTCSQDSRWDGAGADHLRTSAKVCWGGAGQAASS